MSWSGRRSANSLRLCCSAISIRSSRVKRSASTSRSRLLVDFLLGLPAQLQGDDLAGPLTDAVSDVVAGDVEGLAVVCDAPDDDMGVGMAGVVVIDGDPVELGVEVGFHLLHQIAGGLPQVGQFHAVLRRDDEAELVAVVASAFDEGAAVLHVALGGIGLALLAVTASRRRAGDSADARPPPWR